MPFNGFPPEILERVTLSTDDFQTLGTLEGTSKVFQGILNTDYTTGESDWSHVSQLLIEYEIGRIRSESIITFALRINGADMTDLFFRNRDTVVETLLKKNLYPTNIHTLTLRDTITGVTPTKMRQFPQAGQIDIDNTIFLGFCKLLEAFKVVGLFRHLKTCNMVVAAWNRYHFKIFNNILNITTESIRINATDKVHGISVVSCLMEELGNAKTEKLRNITLEGHVMDLSLFLRRLPKASAGTAGRPYGDIKSLTLPSLDGPGSDLFSLFPGIACLETTLGPILSSTHFRAIPQFLRHYQHGDDNNEKRDRVFRLKYKHSSSQFEEDCQKARHMVFRILRNTPLVVEISQSDFEMRFKFGKATFILEKID